MRTVSILGLLILLAPRAHAQRGMRSPLVEVADARVGGDRVRANVGVTGAASTLCLIDTGIDEAAFGDAVVARFDAMGAPLGHPLESRFGGAVGGRSLDRRGHGTAMASIALTLAPDAQIIVATAFDREAGGFPDEAVVRAARFCRAVVEESPALNPRQLVTLLSLGGHDGAHDGRSVFERDLSALADQPIVVAAGNDGSRPVHAGGRITAGERAEVTVRVPRATVDDAHVSLSVHARNESGVVLRVGESSTRILRPGNETRRVGGLVVTLQPDADSPDVIRVVLAAEDGPLESGTYTLTFEGPGDFDVWLADTRLGSPFFPPSLGGPWLSNASVTIPASAPALIAVGASDPDGEVAAYSSVGPTAAGALVPDLVAPGGWMDVALSADLDATDPANLVGGRPELTAEGRVAIRGTSAAAALVAGALLLALEADPTLGPIARDRLVASGGDPSWTPHRGWGELDVPALVRGPPGDREVVLTAAQPLVPSDRVLHLGARGLGALRVEVGQTTREVELEAGATQLMFPIEMAFPAAPPAVGLAVPVRIWLDGRELEPLEVPVVLDRTRRVRPGGGCATVMAGRPGPSALGGLAWAFVSLGRRRRRRRLRGRG
ncbi:MAG: S8 family serine peptidase [Sandaracinaceae bacterium]